MYFKNLLAFNFIDQMKSDSYNFTIHHQMFSETIFWGVNFLKKMSAKVFDNYVENANQWWF